MMISLLRSLGNTQKIVIEMRDKKRSSLFRH
jgi:hypothetical protein